MAMSDWSPIRATNNNCKAQHLGSTGILGFCLLKHVCQGHQQRPPLSLLMESVHHVIEGIHQLATGDNPTELPMGTDYRDKGAIH